MASRVWCWTPNPVLETMFIGGRRIVSAGGKAHNVARQLHQWGVATISVVPKAGTPWLQAARKDRVPIREIPVRSIARKGWALLPGPGDRIDLFTQDCRWNKSDWDRCALFLKRNIRKGEWLAVAGSVPRGVPLGWWRRIFEALNQTGARIVVDGKGQLLREALEAGVDWAKGNYQEMKETVKGRGVGGCLEKMRAVSRGRSFLLMTRGARGLVIQMGKKRLAVPAPRVRLRDATGSGDVVTAALIYGIRKGWEMAKTAGFAVWAGSENAARRNEVVARLKGRGGFA